MSASAHYEPTPGGWEWPDELIDRPGHSSEPTNSSTQAGHNDHAHDNPQSTSTKERHWRPRTCRICLEVVLPTYHPPSENLPGFLQSGPSVTYESEDGGRLLRPCQCKGTSKYVHEGCLQAWRHSNPDYARRNYWECPTCGYNYRLQRLGWSRAISSIGAQVGLTLLVLLMVTFILGFVADPIIDFCLDPSFYGLFFGSGRTTRYDVLPPEDLSGWSEHFMKGFASLGLMSFLKTLFASPVQLFFRSSGGRNRNQGRDRLNGITWIMVLVGVATFLYAIWKGVRVWSKRTLEKAGERVLDVDQAEDGDDEDEEGDATPTT